VAWLLDQTLHQGRLPFELEYIQVADIYIFSSQCLCHNDYERYKFSKFMLQQFGKVYIDYFLFIVFIFQGRLLQELLDLKCPDTVFLGILLTQLQGWKLLEKVAFLWLTSFFFHKKIVLHVETPVIELYIFYYVCILADKIQVSRTTWLLLSMKGGYEMEERGSIEIKVSWHIRCKFE